MALMEHVLELEGKSEEERKHSLLKALEERKFEYDVEKFSINGVEGSNITLEIGTGEKEILVICHYDSFQDSPGANANASAVSVSLDVYRRLQSYKQKDLLRGKVKIIFFGKEVPSINNPRGRAGSRAYVEKYRNNLGNIIAILNPALCGSGDMVGIWPVTNNNRDSKVLDVTKKVLEKIKIEHETIGKLPSIYACYESFRDANVLDSFCLTAIKKEEKENLKLYSESLPIEIGVRNLLGLLFKNLRVVMPELLMRYNSSEDKSSYLSEASLRIMSDSIFNIIVNLDRKFSGAIEEF